MNLFSKNVIKYLLTIYQNKKKVLGKVECSGLNYAQVSYVNSAQVTSTCLLEELTKFLRYNGSTYLNENLFQCKRS